MIDPYYVMIGRYININSDQTDPLKEKYKNKLKYDNINLLFRDLPNKKYDTRPRYQLILELLAMIPLNLFGLIPSLNRIKNMMQINQ